MITKNGNFTLDWRRRTGTLELLRTHEHEVFLTNEKWILKWPKNLIGWSKNDPSVDHMKKIDLSLETFCFVCFFCSLSAFAGFLDLEIWIIRLQFLTFVKKDSREKKLSKFSIANQWFRIHFIILTSRQKT